MRCWLDIISTQYWCKRSDGTSNTGLATACRAVVRRASEKTRFRQRRAQLGEIDRFPGGEAVLDFAAHIDAHREPENR